MAYLTLDEFKSLGYDLEDKTVFTAYANQAGLVIDRATNGFYRKHSLVDDVDLERVTDFKRANAEMISYYAYQGSSKSYELKDGDYKSVSIGRLNLTPNVSSQASLKNGLTEEAYYLLASHGLLYRGLGGDYL
ncbi:hypothetical protein [Ligilactobacillus equi]|uniref:Uncharacterized protein n=1 Tax=Ligilactobacillus equi DPC 6820 TaxID=1392007 RepID=V7I0L5_9LACO|nr:hypothetical protein [Ligilactobacillus equi]ETA75090.1 hypothetical protein LEQ_1148 [Ligilactobacillus equi DPC 6820]